MTALSANKRNEAAMLARMVAIYCDHHHADREKAPPQLRGLLQDVTIEPRSLCWGCARLLIHGLVRLVACPFESKPNCKHCIQPCYAGDYRAFVKTVMRYSGMKLIKSGRLDLIIKYFL